MRKRNKKYKLIAFLFSIILIGIGYAYLTANLKITGTTKIGNARFDVHFYDADIYDTSGDISFPSNSNSNLARGIPVIKGENNTELEWEVIINKPGSYYDFVAEVVNEGDIDAKLDLNSSTIKIKIGDNDEQSYKFSDIASQNGSYAYFVGEIGALWNYINMSLDNQYLNAGDSKLIYGGVYLDEETLTNEEWENLKGKTIEVTVDLKYIQGEDNPHSNSNSQINFEHFFDDFNEGNMKVRVDNAVVSGVGPTTTFTSNSNSNKPIITNKSYYIPSDDEHERWDFTTHSIKNTIIFNNPGDYYEFTVDIINEEDYDIELNNIEKSIKIGLDEENVFYSSLPTSLVNSGFNYEYDMVEGESYFVIPANSSVKVKVKIGLDDSISEEYMKYIVGRKIKLKYFLIYEQYIEFSHDQPVTR